MGECNHRVTVPRDPEQTALSRSCERCGDDVVVMIPSRPPGGR